MADNLKFTTIHGYKTYYNEEVRNGMNRLLVDLDLSEVKPLYDYARMNGSANYEDDYDKQYTLIYDRSKGAYTIISRKS
jgi:hypothetical protein